MKPTYSNINGVIKIDMRLSSRLEEEITTRNIQKSFDSVIKQLEQLDKEIGK
jgi:hypothetical protein